MWARSKSSRSPSGRRAFTLVDLLITLAVIGLAVAMILPAIQRTSCDSRKHSCRNNMRSIMQATWNFYDTNVEFPTYMGRYPTGAAGARALGNTVVYGSWTLHLLPYLGYDAQYVALQGQGAGSANFLGQVCNPSYACCTSATCTSTGTCCSSAAIGRQQTCLKCCTASTCTRTGKCPGACTNTWSVSYSGIWAIPDMSLRVLQCVNDPTRKEPGITPRSGPAAGNQTSLPVRAAPGIVPGNAMGLPWATTNFVVNWHAITNGTVVDFWGLNAQPPTYATQPTVRIDDIKDGLGDTIFLGEAYAWCDGNPRLAWITANAYDNFGLDWNSNKSWYQCPPNTSTSSCPPSSPPPNTMFFQHLPKPAECNNWRAQTNHYGGMNVGMADGSVVTMSPNTDHREVTGNRTTGGQFGVSPTMGPKPGVWDLLMLPRDGGI